MKGIHSEGTGKGPRVPVDGAAGGVGPANQDKASHLRGESPPLAGGAGSWSAIGSGAPERPWPARLMGH